MGQVVHLFLATGSRLPMREVEEAMAVTDRGLEGCRHGRPGSRRQVLLVERETVEGFGLLPGQLRENITTGEFGVNALMRGQRLQIGNAVLEVTGPCEPCSRMDELRMGLQRELYGQRGTLCRVLVGGQIRRGDAIQLAPADMAALKTGGGR